MANGDDLKLDRTSFPNHEPLHRGQAKDLEF